MFCQTCKETFTESEATTQTFPGSRYEPAEYEVACPFCGSEDLHQHACETCEAELPVEGLDQCASCYLTYLIENEPEDPEAIEAFAKEHGLPYSLPGEAA